MNQDNLDYLKKSLKFLGFGDKLNGQLEERIKEQPTQITLLHSGEFKNGELTDKVNFRIDFKKSETSDMYFLNKHEATLKNDDPEKERKQTFYINKGSGITAKEAYNLLNGRAINKDLYNKEDQKYNAWLQLNFSEKDKNGNHIVKQFGKGYGFDLDSTLQRYPIKELTNPDELKRIVESLQKGNLQQVTFVKENKEEKMFIDVSPQYKNLNVYNSRMERQHQGINQKQKPDSDKSTEKKETRKKADEESEPAKKAKKSKGKGVGV